MSITQDLNKLNISVMLEEIETTEINIDKIGYEEASTKAIKIYKVKKPTQKQIKAVILFGEDAKQLKGHI